MILRAGTDDATVRLLGPRRDQPASG